MLTLDEMTGLEPEGGETKQHMEEYLETFDTSLQSDTPYSDVTQVRKIHIDVYSKRRTNSFVMAHSVCACPGIIFLIGMQILFFASSNMCHIVFSHGLAQTFTLKAKLSSIEFK